MPVARRDGVPHTTEHRRRGRSKGSTSPYSNTSKERQTNDEATTEESENEEDIRNSSSEDQIDGTTPRHPRATTNTPPKSQDAAVTTRTTPPVAYHTSSHTNCWRRPTISPKKREDSVDLTTEKTTYDPGNSRTFLVLIVILGIIGFVSLLQVLNEKQEEEVKRPPKVIAEVYADLKKELQRLNREFSQPREVWLGLLSQFEAVMVEEPHQPAVLLFVVPGDSRDVAKCLVHSLAQAIQRAFEDTQFVIFDTRSRAGRNGELLKVEMDDALKGLAKTHTAVIHNIEDIPGPAAMILHAYCDNENAPFKQAIIFLLAEVPGKYKELGYTRLDSVIDSHLTAQWGQGLAEKDVSALISRTSNTPILIRPEDPGRMLKICPTLVG